ncbi:MAG: STAS domain-containing protein [Planctomycetota bacterium]|jgi:anti-sigma B factor antagonist
MNDEIPVEITSETDIAVVVFKAASISNSQGINAVSKQINDYIIERQPTRVIFDFKSVNFFSSQVLGLLLDIRSKVTAFGGELVISAIDPQLFRVFKITNLDKIFKFFPDKDSAVKAFSEV